MSSEIFESDESETIQSKKYFQQRSYKIGVILLGSALFFGLFILPIIVADSECSFCDTVNLWYGSMFPIEQILTENPTNKIIQEVEPSVEEKPQDKGTTSYSQSQEKIILSLSNLPIFEYQVITEGKWTGDFVDTRKIPQGISLEGDKKFQFRCYIDPVLNTATYFGTFKSLEGYPIEVTVFRDNTRHDAKEGSANQAVILEGSC